MTVCPICQVPGCRRCLSHNNLFVGMAELVGERIPQPEVVEGDTDYAWRAWDAAVAAQDARAGL